MDERLDALNVALANEMTEHKFYLQNAERTKNPVGKAMFEQIAKEELEHHERLRQIHANWEKNKAWPATVPLKVNNTAIKEVLASVLKKDATETGGGDADDLAAVRKAIDFEEKGAAFYRRLRDQLTNPQEKAFFGLLASIEHEHYLSLKDTEEYLVDPVSWFRKREGTSLDGA